jgi:hypothetical protein
MNRQASGATLPANFTTHHSTWRFLGEREPVEIGAMRHQDDEAIHLFD